jgi:hypothetical protein
MLPSKKKTQRANLLISLFVVHTNSIPIVKFNFPQQKPLRVLLRGFLEFDATVAKPTVRVNCDVSDVTASQLPRRPGKVSPRHCQKKYFFIEGGSWRRITSPTLKRINKRPQCAEFLTDN